MKKSVKKILAMSLAATMILALAACGDKQTPSTEAPAENNGAVSGEKTFTSSGKTLNVGVQSNVISVPVVYAYQQGYFSDLGLDVNLIVFPNGSPENEGLAAEQLDVASNGLASVYSMASGLCDWIGESDCGSATLQIYTKANSPVFEHKGEVSGKDNMYGSADTLKGLKVLGPTSTIEQWAAVAYFSQFGMEPGKDYEYLNMDRAAAAQAVLTGQGDFFVASDVDYANMMENGGFKSVSNCQDATDTVFNNGYLARKDILSERYDDVVLFLQATFKAAGELQADIPTRNEFTLKYYNDNGKTSTADDVAQESELRPFIQPEEMAGEGYYLGAGMLQVGNFFASIETIEADQVPTIESAINVGPLQDALGITVKPAALK